MSQLSEEAKTYLECLENPINYSWAGEPNTTYQKQITLYECSMWTYKGEITIIGLKALKELRDAGLVGDDPFAKIKGVSC